MSELARQKLVDLIKVHSPSAIGMTGSFGMMLRMACKDSCEEEGAMLNLALQHGVAGEIASFKQTASWDECANFWQRMLMDRGLTANQADWVIDSWGLALQTHPAVAAKAQAAAPTQPPWIVQPQASRPVGPPGNASLLGNSSVVSMILVAFIGLASGAAPVATIYWATPESLSPNPGAAAGEADEVFPGFTAVQIEGKSAARPAGSAKRGQTPRRPRPAAGLGFEDPNAFDLADIFDQEATATPELQRVRSNLLKLKEDQNLLAFYGFLGSIGGLVGGLLGFILGPFMIMFTGVGLLMGLSFRPVKKDWLTIAARLLLGGSGACLGAWTGTWLGIIFQDSGAVFLGALGGGLLGGGCGTYFGTHFPWMLIVLLVDPVLRYVFGMSVFAFSGSLMPLRWVSGAGTAYHNMGPQ